MKHRTKNVKSFEEGRKHREKPPLVTCGKSFFTFLLSLLNPSVWIVKEAGGGDGTAGKVPFSPVWANTTQSQAGLAESSGAMAPHEYRAGAFLTQPSERVVSFPSLFSA